MNHTEFKEAFEGLTQIYGDKAYPLAIKGRLFSMVSDLDKTEFVRVVDSLVMEHTKPPAAGLILKAALPFLRVAWARRQAKATEQLMARPIRCKLCDHYGLIFVYSRANWGHEFAFRCTECDAAQIRKIGSIPPWRPEFSRDFLTLKEKWAAEAEVQAKAPKLSPAERESLRAKLRAMAAKASGPDDFTWGEL